jgi:hypothetical protein
MKNNFEMTLTASHARQSLGRWQSTFTLHDITRGCSMPDTWNCIDCGENTAPGMSGANDVLEALNAGRGIKQKVDKRSEIYTASESVWRAARMGDHDGCLCVGCLENRLGRMLNREDFIPWHVFNGPHYPRTKRLKDRLERAPDVVMREAA